MSFNPSLLPIEIIHKIINYTGVVTFYKGKYYNKILSSDKRYEMLSRTIRQPVCRHNELSNDDNDILIILDLRPFIGESYNTVRFKLIRTNNVNKRDILCVSKQFNQSFSQSKYILTNENKWSKIVDYIQ